MSVTGATSITGGGSNVEEPIIPDTELEPSSSPDEGVQDGEVTPTEVVEGDQPQGAKPGEGEIREDGRLIPKWMRALKESNPEGFKKAKADLFELMDRRTLHPTAQAAREEHDLVQSLGGKEGVGKLREQSTFYSEAANQFLKGD